MDVIAAICLLTALPGDLTYPPTEADWPALRDYVQRVAMEWEILDRRETTYIFASRTAFAVDLDTLRRRRIEFQDAPRIIESERLPEMRNVCYLIDFNRAYRRGLSERAYLELDRADILDAAIGETDELCRVYDAARDSRCEFYFVTVRRQALRRLREGMTDAEWAAGVLPPCVPTWRFNER